MFHKRQKMVSNSVDMQRSINSVYELWNTQQESDERSKEFLQKKIDLDDARHLLERVGIGANIKEVKKLVGMTRSKAVSYIINEIKTESWLPLPKFLDGSNPPYWIVGDLNSEEEQSFRVARDREMNEYRLWWIKEMIETPSPQTERLVLFWHNHFVSSYSAINEQSTSIARQNIMFRELGSGNFKMLTKSVIKDPAMLNYLDNEFSEKGKPNENLSRELMELFVLGEGNYSEKTVREGARALTGYSVNKIKNTSFFFDGWRHDNGVKNIFDRSGDFNGDQFVDILFEQANASEFLTRKFWRYFVSEVIEDEDEIRFIAKRFKTSDFDIRTLLRSVLTSKTFWDESVRATIVKSPVDFLIGTIRSTGFLPADWNTLPNKLTLLGQNLFEHPNVAGWPGGQSWITPSGLLNRSYLAKNFFSSLGSNVENMVNAQTAPVEMTKRSIALRYASEDYKGPSKFKIQLINNSVKKEARNPFMYGDYEVLEKLVGDEWIHATLTFKDVTSKLEGMKKAVTVGLEGHAAWGDFYGIELTEDTFETEIPQELSVYKDTSSGVFFINSDSLRDGTFDKLYRYLPSNDKRTLQGLCSHLGKKEFLDNLLVKLSAKESQAGDKFWADKAKFNDIQYLSKRCLRSIEKTGLIYSSTHNAVNGHDTEKFGRIKDNSQLPWQTLQLNIENSDEFDTVEIMFMNDHCCGPGGSDNGDRNFFVDWIKVDNELFLSSDGEQHGNTCDSDPGYLYCGGWVEMRKSISLAESNSSNTLISDKKDKLYVERAGLSWMNRFKKNRDWNEIAINLLNVKFNNIRYNALRIKLVKRKNGNLFLMLSSRGCYPDCFENRWPHKVHKSDRPPYIKDIKISLILRNIEDHEAHYWGLNKPDRQFVDALWASIPQILEEIKNGRQWKRAIERERTDGWSDTLDFIANTLPKTRYVASVGSEPLIVRPSRESVNMMSMMEGLKTDIPFPANTKPKTSLSEIEKSFGDTHMVSLADLFLSTDPVVISRTVEDISTIITDPVYNLK